MLVFVLCLRPNPVLVDVSAAGASTFALGALGLFVFSLRGGGVARAHSMWHMRWPPYFCHLIATTLLCTLPCDPSDAAMFPLMQPCSL